MGTELPQVGTTWHKRGHNPRRVRKVLETTIEWSTKEGTFVSTREQWRRWAQGASVMRPVRMARGW